MLQKHIMKILSIFRNLGQSLFIVMLYTTLKTTYLITLDIRKHHCNNVRLMIFGLLNIYIHTYIYIYIYIYICVNMMIDHIDIDIYVSI